MAKDIKRAYNYEDEEMLVKSQVIHDNLVNDMAAFSAAFPTITAATATALQADINTADALPLDGEVVDNLAVLTESVNAQVILGGEALEELNRYAQFTYPDEKRKQRVFGQDRWDKARQDQEKMVNALEQANNMATTSPYHGEMEANGYTAAKAANLLTLASEIRTRNLLQENAKAQRPLQTQDRVLQYNAVWNQLKPINIASKVVFKDDPAKLALYMLYPSSTATTTINITLFKDSDALENVELSIAGSSLAPQITDARGQATFSSTALGELITINASHATEGSRTFENISIVPGASNEVELEW